MIESPAASDVKISNRPEIQKQVDLQSANLENQFPDAGPNLINRFARDKVASILRIERIKRESAIDELTTLLSSKAYKAEKSRILETNSRDGNMPSIQGIRFDLDDFGNVNKQFGQETGNKVLAAIGRTIKMRIRKSDTAGRIGGEEFEITAPRTENPHRTPNEKPIPLSEKIRIAINNAEMGNGIKITASFGITEYQKGEDIEEYNKRLENAQVAAKRLGKNRVVEARKIKNGHVYIDHSTNQKYKVERDSEGKILDPVEII